MPVVKIRRLVHAKDEDKEHDDDVDDQHDEDKEHHLLELLHDCAVERKADDESDAHDQEEDGADDVHHQVDGEVSHLEKLLGVCFR